MINPKDHSGGLLVDPAYVERNVDRKNRQAHGVIFRTSYLLGQGNYRRAIDLFEEAKPIRQNNPELL